jgi:hypothetical protein
LISYPFNLEEIFMRRIVILASAAATAFCLPSVAMSAPQAALTTEGFMQAWGTSNATYDLNGDGTVNAVDLGMFLSLTSSSSQEGEISGATSGSNLASNPSGSAGQTVQLPTVRAGTGFGGMTAVPNAIGDSTDPLSDERAIARWVDVPFQVRSGLCEIGVTAFHANGIDRVEFSLNGGPWIAVTSPSQSAAFGIDCFRAQVDMNSLEPNATGEVRAIVYPKTSGQPVVLQNALAALGLPDGASGIDGRHSFFVSRPPESPAKEVFVAISGNNSNVGSATQPVATITKALDLLRIAGGCDGGFVTILEPGVYGAPASTPVAVNNQRWTTIRSANGLAPTSVQIVSTASNGTLTGKNLIRTRFKRLKWESVAFDMSAIKQLYAEPNQYLWIDRSKFSDANGAAYNHANGGTLLVRPSELMSGSYVTDSLATNIVHGFTHLSFVRNSHVDSIIGDAYTNSRCVLGSSLANFFGQSTAIHSDVFQLWGIHANNIVHRFRAWDVNGAQNFLLDSHLGSEFTDCAFVDIAIENLQPSPNSPKSQLANKSKNVLFAHINAPNQYWSFRDDFAAPKTFSADSVVFKNCVLSWLSRALPGWTGVPAGVTVSHCHFCIASGSPLGAGITNSTTGALTLQSDGLNWSVSGSGATAILGTATQIPGLSSETTADRGQLPGSVTATHGTFAIGSEAP